MTRLCRWRLELRGESLSSSPLSPDAAGVLEDLRRRFLSLEAAVARDVGERGMLPTKVMGFSSSSSLADRARGPEPSSLSTSMGSCMKEAGRRGDEFVRSIKTEGVDGRGVEGRGVEGRSAASFAAGAGETMADEVDAAGMDEKEEETRPCLLMELSRIACPPALSSAAFYVLWSGNG